MEVVGTRNSRLELFLSLDEAVRLLLPDMLRAPRREDVITTASTFPVQSRKFCVQYVFNYHLFLDLKVYSLSDVGNWNRAVHSGRKGRFRYVVELCNGAAAQFLGCHSLPQWLR